MKNTILFTFLVVLAAGVPTTAANSQQQTGRPACPALGPKTVIGAAGGAAAGAAIGSVLDKKARGFGAALGGLTGGLLGGAIGKSLDQQDCQQAQAAMQRMSATPTGQQIPWSNSATGNHGTLTPTSDPTTTADGRVCRQYHRDAVTQDGTQTDGGYGVTCRDANGDWQAQS